MRMKPDRELLNSIAMNMMDLAFADDRNDAYIAGAQARLNQLMDGYRRNGYTADYVRREAADVMRGVGRWRRDSIDQTKQVS